jgi:plastocyanin
MNAGLILGVVAIGALLMYKQDPSFFEKIFKTGGGAVATAPPVVPPTTIPGAPVSSAGLTPAAQVVATETLTIPSSFGGAVIEIPNEGHHGPGTKDCLSKENCVMLPSTLIAPSGIKICWISDDAGHDHTIAVDGGEKTAVIKTDTASNALTFATPGSFTYKDVGWAGGGKLTITADKAAGTGTAGAVYCPVGEEAAYTAIIKGLGMEVASTAPSGAKVSVIVYTSTSDPASTAAKISAVTKKTPWG